jgi:hypothetical protein
MFLFLFVHNTNEGRRGKDGLNYDSLWFVCQLICNKNSRKSMIYELNSTSILQFTTQTTPASPIYVLCVFFIITSSLHLALTAENTHRVEGRFNEKK